MPDVLEEPLGTLLLELGKSIRLLMWHATNSRRQISISSVPLINKNAVLFSRPVNKKPGRENKFNNQLQK